VIKDQETEIQKLKDRLAWLESERQSLESEKDSVSQEKSSQLRSLERVSLSGKASVYYSYVLMNGYSLIGN